MRIRRSECIPVEAVPGTHVRESCEAACELAELTNSEVWLKFNGVVLVVLPSSKPTDVHATYNSRSAKP